MAVITCDDVRYRLGMNAIDLPDAMLNSPAFIPDAEIWIEDQLGHSVDSLSGNDLAAAKTAMIAYTARKALTTAPAATVRGGPVEYAPSRAADKLQIAAELDKEIADKLRFLGVSSASFASAVYTGNYDEVQSAW